MNIWCWLVGHRWQRRGWGDRRIVSWRFDNSLMCYCLRCERFVETKRVEVQA